MLPSQHIGEALHVYACRWLPDTSKTRSPESSASQTAVSVEKSRRILETIVSMIPAERGSVSPGFLLRLLTVANHLGFSPATKAELRRRASVQFAEATVNDLIFPSQLSSDQHSCDIDLVMAVLESYLVLWRRQSPATAENSQILGSIRKVAKLIDSYLQIAARDVNMPVLKVVALAEALPDSAREDHDNLYKFINTYLKEHPGLSKADKRLLCRILDRQKLSPEVRAHAVKTERLPLRTVVQVLFFEHESGSRGSGNNYKMASQSQDLRRLQLGADIEEVRRKSTVPGTSEKEHQKVKRSEGKLQMESENSNTK